ncbi:S8 family serine peptidase [Actinoplanes sp. KI2]|uniref:S8 family peptidase n=1 Tax=Actinoplanes sp. KI2 TaxID=2983315 RepID=UPI0021D582FA|nr:S8 family serine peptidase [Actinoplanes sp. KI2]MCU7730684.1 S8 family serine peptidase [Actinoplanes sp. KI2]
MSTTTDPAGGGRLTWRLIEQDQPDLTVIADGQPVAPEWAWGGATGTGVRVCVVDSGVEPDHPLVGPVRGSWATVLADDGYAVTPVEAADVCGHGTACAGIIRRLAPDCEIFSVRVLGSNRTCTGDGLLAGLRWAIRQDFDVINLSLSTTRTRYADGLRALADEAYFRRIAIVASAHNVPVESFPWRFSSVISVGSHHQEDQPDLFLYNPQPPVEFFAPGQNIELAWTGGGSIRASGNSFATPFIAGLCARILSKHPRMTTFQLKNVLYLAAANVNIYLGENA